MSRVQITEQAEEDLTAIQAYIRRDSKVNAKRFLK
jgi:plasmid stabilization system protein ParE